MKLKKVSLSVSKMRQFETTTANLVLVLSFIKSCVSSGKRYKVSIDECGARSLSANALYHVWVKQVSDFTGEDLKTVAARFKRDHGLPILLSGRNRFEVDKELTDSGYYNMNDHEQLLFVGGMKVTRRFSIKDQADYLNSIQSFWYHYGVILDSKS